MFICKKTRFVKAKNISQYWIPFCNSAICLMIFNLCHCPQIFVSGLLQIEFLSKGGVKVSHCPASAMRMLGFAPIREMLDAGICVSLGTDGAPSNNRMSIGLSIF